MSVVLPEADYRDPLVVLVEREPVAEPDRGRDCLQCAHVRPVLGRHGRQWPCELGCMPSRRTDRCRRWSRG